MVKTSPTHVGVALCGGVLVGMLGATLGAAVAVACAALLVASALGVVAGLPRLLHARARREARSSLARPRAHGPFASDPEERLASTARHFEGATPEGLRTLEDLLEAARAALRADHVAYFTAEPNGALQLRASAEARSSGSEVNSGAVLSSGSGGALVAIRQTHEVVRLLPSSSGPALGYEVDGRVGAFVGAPVLARRRRSASSHVGLVEDCVGVLVAGRAAAVSFCDEEVEVLRAMSRALHRALECERLAEDAARVQEDDARFHQALQRVTGSRSSDDFAESFVEAVSCLVEVELVAFVALDVQAEAFEVRAVGGRGDAEGAGWLGARFGLSQGGLIARALELGQPLPFRARQETPAAPSLEVAPGLALLSLSSGWIVPLRGRPDRLGALVIAAASDGEILSGDEQRLVQVLVTYASATLDNARMFERMAQMASTDGLTKLANHRRFKELLSEALGRSSRHGRPLAVVMLDADHFKAVNDRFGHPEGDRVLVKLAEILRSEARSVDVVARYGGEEFALVLEETGMQGALALAERIRVRIASAFSSSAARPVSGLTASFGVAVWPEHGPSPEQLLERADQALYQSKHLGRNRVTLWSSEIEEAADMALSRARSPSQWPSRRPSGEPWTGESGERIRAGVRSCGSTSVALT